jgi:palmitoyltransferase
MTTIEGWEVERHHAILRRARTLGGFLNGPDGSQVKIEHQEFPFDVGIWTNICRGMGTANVFTWLWPFAASPKIEDALNYEHNLIDGTYHTHHKPTTYTDRLRPKQALATSRS